MRRRNQREWATLVAGYERSELTLGQYAARKGVQPRTLAWWAWRLRRQATEDAPALVPLRVVAAATEPAPHPDESGMASIEVELPDRVRLRFPPGAPTALIVAVVQQLRRC